jgi:hypothetical protein
LIISRDGSLYSSIMASLILETIARSGWTWEPSRSSSINAQTILPWHGTLNFRDRTNAPLAASQWKHARIHVHVTVRVDPRKYPACNDNGMCELGLGAEKGCCWWL